MSNASKRVEGAAEELSGKIKTTFGKAIGNERMVAAGKARELKGQAKQQAAKAVARGKGVVEEAAGAAKSRVGAALDNEKTEAAAKAKELKAQVRQGSG